MDWKQAQHIKKGMEIQVTEADLLLTEILSDPEAHLAGPVQVFTASPSGIAGHTNVLTIIGNVISGTFIFPNDHLVQARQCLDAAMGETDCTGELITEPSLSGSGTMITRCTGHREKRLQAHEKHMRRYPDSDTPPAWHDESEAGERWNDDY